MKMCQRNWKQNLLKVRQNKPKPFLYCPFKQRMIVVIVHSRLVHLDNQMTRIYSRRENRFDAFHENNGYSCSRVVTSS